MRKITEEVCKSFLKIKACKVGNTHTDGFNLFLHGNLIATFDNPFDHLQITTAGRNTPTTREMLNGLLILCDAKICIIQKKGKLFIKSLVTGDLAPWDGSLLYV